MYERKILDLPLENGQKFFLKPDYLKELRDELELFLSDNESMNNLDFTKKVLFSHELQSNNQVEGYGDDIKIINDIITRKVRKISDIEKKRRILNLYKGYQFILKYKRVNEISLKKLYDILSKDLLIPYDLQFMGELYREDAVYIVSDFLDLENCEQGIDYNNISNLITNYFNFFNNTQENNITGDFINSQILHFYFVYIHPYFDVNGRTSRTMSMWYLLKKEAYPYIIFNRGIPFHCNDYYDVIKNSKMSHDLTSFILYMMREVKIELEKEFIVQNIASNVNYELTSEDYQTILYFMSINGLKSVLDFTSLYNRLIEKKKVKEIYDSMIVPLIDKDVLEVVRYTKKNMFGNTPNMVLELNKKKIDCDLSKVKRLQL